MILMSPTRINTCLNSMIDKKCRPDGAQLSKIIIVLPKCQPFGLSPRDLLRCLKILIGGVIAQSFCLFQKSYFRWLLISYQNTIADT